MSSGFKKVSILGCGWLGFPLAKRLIQEGHEVKGSTTHKQKLGDLKQAGIKTYLIEYLPTPKVSSKDFFESDVLFLNIPFRRHLNDPRYYARQIESVLGEAKGANLKYLIFASSTAVYPQGLKNATEEACFLPDDERASVLLGIEEKLLKKTDFKTTIIRFGGLYGEGRPIGKFLAAKKKITGACMPVNLIHLDDCIEILVRLIKQGTYAGVLNAVSDGHPKRQDLYTKAAEHLGLEPPTFLKGEIQRDYKIVSNEKIKEILNYQFIHPDPMAL